MDVGLRARAEKVSLLGRGVGVGTLLGRLTDLVVAALVLVALDVAALVLEALVLAPLLLVDDLLLEDLLLVLRLLEERLELLEERLEPLVDPTPMCSSQMTDKDARCPS
ncbi:hypothetical protein [Myxococcus landrumensis]|uniref:Uncharacterized protein n=1 Tax=Myxococcus landrumensis TaxID=2813577 RepID=A0ABX7N2C9_9BACT|nr:hypothetical protein [Myxococcus landrumus]QSQ11551.1 hypothetical protein JY572_24460 [Myxococcus landrumus]